MGHSHQVASKEASLLEFLPGTVGGRGSVVTSLGTGAGGGTFRSPPAPLPAAEASSSLSWGQGCPGPAPAHPPSSQTLGVKPGSGFLPKCP